MSRLRVWTCKDGRRVAIKDMQTSHIKNTRNMLEKKAEMLSAPEEVYLGDEMFSTSEIDGYEVDVYGTPLWKWLHDFDAELARRGEA